MEFCQLFRAINKLALIKRNVEKDKISPFKEFLQEFFRNPYYECFHILVIILNMLSIFFIDTSETLVGRIPTIYQTYFIIFQYCLSLAYFLEWSL
jgi:magnesium-transporting ATPase (P-type)